MACGKDIAMSVKLIGIILIIGSCGAFGFSLASSHRREEKCLRQLIAALDYMACELQYRLTPLPSLCRQAACESCGVIRQVLTDFTEELEDQVSPNVSSCMSAALRRSRDVPSVTKECLTVLGQSLGRFDLEGQLRGLESIRQTCRHKLEGLETNKEVRLRSYQTLGLCVGAALAILLI